MVTLNTLRNKGGVLLAIVIGIALLAFVLGDMFTSGSTLMNSSKMNVGTIDGEKISMQEYSHAIDELTEVQRITTGREGSGEEQNEMIRVQAWDLMIRNKALKPALSEVGLTVSDDELVDLMSGANPSPILVQMFGDPQTGRFEPAMLRQLLANVEQDPTGRLQIFWNYLQGEVADQNLIFKFKTLVDKAAYVTAFEAERMAALEGETYSVDYLVSRYESVADSTVAVSDAALRKYYDTHRGMFRQPDARDIEYVTFEALPSQEDYAAAEKNVREMADELRTTGNVRQFVSMNSHNPFDARYYKAGELTGELGTFAFGAASDEVYGPVLAGDQWTMARVADVQTMPDSVRLSSIVIPAESICRQLVERIAAWCGLCRSGAGPFGRSAAGRQRRRPRDDGSPDAGAAVRRCRERDERRGYPDGDDAGSGLHPEDDRPQRDGAPGAARGAELQCGSERTDPQSGLRRSQ